MLFTNILPIPVFCFPAAPQSYLLASSPSPFSSSSPENVEDSGLDSPSHPVTGPSRLWSPRPCTPQSPLNKRVSKSSLSLRGNRCGLPAEDGPSPWLPQPASRDHACFVAEPDWVDSVSAWPAVAHSNLPCQREEMSSAPSAVELTANHQRAWTARPRSPASDCPPRACERDSCLSSNSASSSSSSPAPPSSGDSTSPSPWAPRGRDSENGTPAVPDASSESGEKKSLVLRMCVCGDDVLLQLKIMDREGKIKGFGGEMIPKNSEHMKLCSLASRTIGPYSSVLLTEPSNICPGF